MRGFVLSVLLAGILSSAGCGTIKHLLPSDGPEARIREIPAKYSGSDSYYEEAVFTVEEGATRIAEGVRLQVAVQHPDRFKLDVSGPESYRLVSDGERIGVQGARESKLSLQPLPDPLRFYHITGLLDRYKANPYLTQSLVLPWVFREMESQADVLQDASGVEEGTYWGEECIVFTYEDEAVRRLWRAQGPAAGGMLRVWVHQYEPKIVREEWQVRLEEGRREIHLVIQHRNIRLGADLESTRFALEAMPMAESAGTAAAATASPAGSGPGGEAAAAGGATQAAGGTGPVEPPAADAPALPEGPRGVALGTLIRLLRDPSPENATAAAVALHRDGRPEGMRYLAEWVKSRQPRWVASAAHAAAEAKEKSLKDSLLAQTAIADGVARVWVLRALYALGDTSQLNALEDCLKRPEVDVQIEATKAITDVGGRAVLDTLIANLGSSDADLRVWSAHALGELGDGRAREPLEAALSGDTDSGVRHYAALALRKIGDPRSREPLAKALRDDPYRPVRLQAAGGLARLGDRNVFEFILAMLKSSHPDARHEALLVLGALADPAAAEPLRQFTLGESPPPDDELEEAVISLGKIGGPVALETLRRLLTYDSERVRVQAATLLARQGEPAALDALARLTGSSHPEVALAAAKALLQ